MNYQDVMNEAKTCMGAYCKVCPVCNGRACKNQMPGPGAKGVGDTAIRNYEKWQEIRVNMDTICENKPVDTSLELFGKAIFWQMSWGRSMIRAMLSCWQGLFWSCKIRFV